MSGDDSFFKDRGIKPEIHQRRPYIPYTPEKPEKAREWFADQSPGQRAHIRNITAQEPGLCIVRYAPPLPRSLPKIYPELRPANPVATDGPKKHWHGDGPEPEGLLPWQRLRGDPTKHIEKKEKESPVGEDAIRRIAARNLHNGVNTEELHPHQKLAKYVHASSPKIDAPYEHDHETAWKTRAARDRPAYRQAHIAKRHKGNKDGPHPHNLRVKDWNAPEIARRIDVHPWGVERLLHAEVVFFAIEGCPKSDAMLSDGAAVFNVPSVGQWNCEELPDFVEKYLTDKTVIIVNDHDWETKPEVITQARMCQIVLERLGVPVTHVAAPPATYNGLETKGYDDLQGAGGHLEDLLVIDSDPSPILHDWIMERASRRDQARRDEDVLRALSSYCGSMGVFPLQLTTLALIMATYVNRVCRGVQSLERLGAAVVDVKGDLATRRNYPFSRQIEWDERPTITLIPELRSTDGPKQRLGDLIQLPLRAQGAIAYVS